MNQVERLYKIEQLLGEAHTVPITAMLERLEIPPGDAAKLKKIDPGILAGQIEPLAVRLRALLGSSGDDIAEVEKRIKLLQVGARRANPQHFSHIARAVLTRRPNHKSADPLHLTRQRRSHRPPDLAAAPGC